MTASAFFDALSPASRPRPARGDDARVHEAKRTVQRFAPVLTAWLAPLARAYRRAGGGKQKWGTHADEDRVFSDVTSGAYNDNTLAAAHSDLLSALDRYDMHIGAYLLRPVDFASLPGREQTQLEDARKRILDLVSTMTASEQFGSRR
jgi:hypothetical protein